MSVDTLKAVIDELAASYAKNFDPVRLALLQSLSERLGKPEHADNLMLIKKAGATAKRYKVDLKSQRQDAEKVLKRVTSDFVEQQKVAHALFEQCKYAQLAQLDERLRKRQRRKTSLAELRSLNSSLQQQIHLNRAEDATSIDSLLQQQEQGIRSAVGEAKNSPSDEHLELRSMKAFRASLKYFNVDKTLERAINDQPENPGPHNPHMLAVRSLVKMRALSPHYLRRFAGHIETLLVLEKIATKISNDKK